MFFGYRMGPFGLSPVLPGFKDKITNAPMYTDMFEVYRPLMPGIWLCTELVDKKLLEASFPITKD